MYQRYTVTLSADESPLSFVTFSPKETVKFSQVRGPSTHVNIFQSVHTLMLGKGLRSRVRFPTTKRKSRFKNQQLL